MTGSEDERTVNDNINNNYETVQVLYVIESDSDSYDGSNCNMEDSDFGVDDEDITNFHKGIIR